MNKEIQMKVDRIVAEHRQELFAVLRYLLNEGRIEDAQRALVDNNYLHAIAEELQIAAKGK